MEPVSAFAWLCSSNDPQIQLQSDCFSSPLSLRGNSEEWDCCGSAPAVCPSAERRGGDEGRKERGREGGAGSLWSLADIPVSSPKLLLSLSFPISGNSFAKNLSFSRFCSWPQELL